MLEGYAEWCMDTFDSWGVNRIVHVGDFIDYHAVSRHISEVGYSDPVQEQEKAYVQIQHMQDVFGKKVECLLGNHDQIPARLLKEFGVPPEWLRSPNQLWDLEWTFYPRYHKLQIDDYQIMHGDQGRGGKTPALAKAEADWTSTVAGHHHSAAGVWYGCNNNSRYWGMSVGCGVDHKHAAMAYGKTFAQKPMLGCGVVIDGIPYFEPMPKVNKFGRVIR
jgi:hypothetical protein